ncbi:hypothetical protein DRP07_02160 [Archaeoglobales archaeon]|nr:MAG: hypothetical protein DRP07_02160 [Archaeoglobales archaeon]
MNEVRKIYVLAAVVFIAWFGFLTWAILSPTAHEIIAKHAAEDYTEGYKTAREHIMVEVWGTPKENYSCHKLEELENKTSAQQALFVGKDFCFTARVVDLDIECAISHCAAKAWLNTSGTEVLVYEVLPKGDETLDRLREINKGDEVFVRAELIQYGKRLIFGKAWISEE